MRSRPDRTARSVDTRVDLVLKNNVARPFWHGLNSPLIFVECKNWANPVGAGEVRDFEVKLQNHRPLARVGILVAPGGFTAGVAEAIRRASREDYIVVLVSRTDLDRLVTGSSSILDWLEDLLSHPV